MVSMPYAGIPSFPKVSLDRHLCAGVSRGNFPVASFQVVGDSGFASVGALGLALCPQAHA